MLINVDDKIITDISNDSLRNCCVKEYFKRIMLHFSCMSHILADKKHNSMICNYVILYRKSDKVSSVIVSVTFSVVIHTFRHLPLHVSPKSVGMMLWLISHSYTFLLSGYACRERAIQLLLQQFKNKAGRIIENSPLYERRDFIHMTQCTRTIIL